MIMKVRAMGWKSLGSVGRGFCGTGIIVALMQRGYCARVVDFTEERVEIF